MINRLSGSSSSSSWCSQLSSSGSGGGGSWNTRLRELAKEGLFKEGLELYRQMLRSGASPNAFSFPFAIKSCAALSLAVSGAQLHSHVVKTGCDPEPFVETSLISMYCKCSLIDNARKVFDQSPHSTKLSVCYNALLSGYTRNSQPFDTLHLFRQMRRNGLSFNAITMLGVIPSCVVPLHLSLGMSFHACVVSSGIDSDPSVRNCILTMYVRCGSIDLARKVFDEIPNKGLITWNAMLSGYAQNGLGSHVLDLYSKMESFGVDPDPVTLVGVLSACANLGAQRVGRDIEQRIMSSGFGFNLFLRNALINMYARCGNLAQAKAIFEETPEKNVISWMAIIAGYGMHGYGEVAVQLFDEMRKTGIQPDRTAFVGVLSACSHAGLTNKGLDYFAEMLSYGLHPGPEHYTCIVDLLGRAGRLDEALELIKSMPVKPDGAVWGALLGACKIHGKVELAELAFAQVIELEPANVGYYVLLSNIYSDAESLEGVTRVRAMIRERKLKKEPGCSYVEHGERVHLFFAGDRSHPQSEEMYKMLDKLDGLVKQNSESKKISSREKGNEEEVIIARMGVHSEKLAIAFGMLNSEPGMEIVVIKNLRVCGDCHLFMKLVSKIVDRRFVIRDATRFHHFNGGVCSCNDYW